MSASGAPGVDSKRPSIAASFTGCAFRDVGAVAIAGWKDASPEKINADERAGANETARELLVALRKQIVGADAGNQHAARDHRTAEDVQKLPNSERLEQHGPNILQLDMRPFPSSAISDGMLHPCIGNDDEEAGEPRTDPDEQCRERLQRRRRRLRR